MKNLYTLKPDELFAIFNAVGSFKDEFDSILKTLYDQLLESYTIYLNELIKIYNKMLNDFYNIPSYVDYIIKTKNDLKRKIIDISNDVLIYCKKHNDLCDYFKDYSIINTPIAINILMHKCRDFKNLINNKIIHYNGATYNLNLLASVA